MNLTKISAAAAQELMKRWSIGTSSRFCDDAPDWDSAAESEVAAVIQSVFEGSMDFGESPTPSPTKPVECLKPCPFCGSDEVLMMHDHGGDGRGFHMGQCNECGSSGPEDLNKSRAVEEWNARTPSAPSSCGSETATSPTPSSPPLPSVGETLEQGMGEHDVPPAHKPN